VTISPSSASPTRRRMPLTTKVACGLLVPLAALSAFGAVMFGVVWDDDGLGSGLVFTAVHLALAVTAVAAVPSLLRAERIGWLLTTGWSFAFSYWSVYKVFAEEEFESTPFLVVGLVVLGLLLAPPTRRAVQAR
jgi:hypothetical protein